VLLAGSDARVLGLSSRTRNARVARRAGATIVDEASSPRGQLSPAIEVPAGVLIDAGLFKPRPPSPGRIQPDGIAALDISTGQARSKAAWTLLRRTGKSSDGWVSRHLNRPVSRIVSWVLLSCGLSASHASFLTLLIGLVGALVAAEPGYVPFVVAGILFHVASILDGVDGEMARVTLTESEWGARIDTIVDQVTYVAFFAGMAVGWAREGSSREVAIWTVLIAAALVASLGRGARFVAAHAPNASFVFIDRTVRRAARDAGATLRAVASMFTLLRRDVFAIVFLAVSLTGQRLLVPALVAFGILLANFTFSFYGRELAAAAAAERSSSR
jgi:CDP-L-myo-inositol myo-inositolphosphotransferase